MVAEEVDEATSMLIARMLAEDDAYEDAYGLDCDDSDDEWGKSKKKAKPKKAKPKKRVKEDDVYVDEEGAEYTASGRRKRKDAGKKRTVPRAWTDDEERLFREALKLHGRDWKSCANHVGTRDARSFTSHAQKYFIKMCLQGRPLPKKVAESGEGYTLSGKPLDPNSAAARAYGFKPDTLEKMKESGMAKEVEGGLQVDGENVAIATEAEAEADKENHNINPKPKLTKKPRIEKAPAKESPQPAPQIPLEPTEYAKNRPKRENAGKNMQTTYVSSMSGSLRLIPCAEFIGVPGAVSSSSQPFAVHIEDEAMLVIDLHAHLSCYEIIGYLGGKWNAEEKRLSIKKAFPCQGLAGTQQTDSCEMDPESELKAKDKMDALGLQVVGWYHSHPTFKPNPSEKDIENQENYQAFFHDKCANFGPFVGMIFSPYDLRLPSRASRREMFWVKKDASQPVPMHMKSDRNAIHSVPSEDTGNSMKTLIEEIQEYGRINLTELWRPFTNIVDGKLPDGGPCTKLAKLRGALTEYLPETEESEDFLDSIFTHIQNKWGLDLGY